MTRNEALELLIDIGERKGHRFRELVVDEPDLMIEVICVSLSGEKLCGCHWVIRCDNKGQFDTGFFERNIFICERGS